MSAMLSKANRKWQAEISKHFNNIVRVMGVMVIMKVEMEVCKVGPRILGFRETQGVINNKMEHARYHHMGSVLVKVLEVIWGLIITKG